MPYKKIEEGFLFNSAGSDIFYLSTCFASAVRDACDRMEKGRTIKALVAKYVREDPHGDVLLETKRLFDVIGSEIDKKALPAVEELRSGLEDVRAFYFLVMPGYVLSRYKRDLMEFFSRIFVYLASWVEKNRS